MTSVILLLKRHGLPCQGKGKQSEFLSSPCGVVGGGCWSHGLRKEESKICSAASALHKNGRMFQNHRMCVTASTHNLLHCLAKTLSFTHTEVAPSAYALMEVAMVSSFYTQEAPGDSSKGLSGSRCSTKTLFAPKLWRAASSKSRQHWIR